MKMKMTFSVLAAVGVLVAAAPAGAQQTLSESQTVACQAILCLATPHPPGACEPPLVKYFSIVDKYWSDTIQDRLNFLNQCPAANQTPAMSQLTQQMASGAGQCDAPHLNGALRIYAGGDSGTWEISDQMPAYCTALYGNSLTILSPALPKYVGTPATGGYWADSADYATDEAAWQAQQSQAQNCDFGAPCAGGSGR